MYENWNHIRLKIQLNYRHVFLVVYLMLNSSACHSPHFSFSHNMCRKSLASHLQDMTYSNKNGALVKFALPLSVIGKADRTIAQLKTIQQFRVTDWRIEWAWMRTNISGRPEIVRGECHVLSACRYVLIIILYTLYGHISCTCYKYNFGGRFFFHAKHFHNIIWILYFNLKSLRLIYVCWTIARLSCGSKDLCAWMLTQESTVGRCIAWDTGCCWVHISVHSIQ